MFVATFYNKIYRIGNDRLKIRSFFQGKYGSLLKIGPIGYGSYFTGGSLSYKCLTKIEAMLFAPGQA